MGIDIGAALIVGKHFDDLQEHIDNCIEKQDNDGYDARDVIEDWGFDVASPYYDAGYDKSYIGVSIQVDPKAGADILAQQIKKAKQMFFHKTGVKAEIHITPNVY